MRVIISGHDAALAQWAASRIEHVGEAGFGPCTALGVATGFGAADRLLAVVVYHSQAYNCIELSCASASPRWASPSVLRSLLAYPFEQLGCRKVWTATPSTNSRAIRFNEGIGFRREAVLRHHYAPRVHAVICSMLAAEYRKKWALYPKAADEPLTEAA